MRQTPPGINRSARAGMKAGLHDMQGSLPLSVSLCLANLFTSDHLGDQSWHGVSLSCHIVWRT
jgi:hypothetical protein